MSARLLKDLADGAFHSGADLAREHSVSRTSIWQWVQQIEALGVTVHKVRGRGYRIPGGLDLLNAEVIESRMSPEARKRFGVPDVRMTVSSTNDVVLESAQKGRPSHLCLAEFQLAGRGRRGRAWVSPFGATSCVSFLDWFSGGPASVEGLSLGVGLGVARFLDRLGVIGVTVKWPNDVLIQDEKVAGILIEISGDLSGDFCAVIGFGLNLALAQHDVCIDQPWTDLMSHLPNLPTRNELLPGLFNELSAVLDTFKSTGFSGLQEEWRRFDHLYGKEVCLSTGTQKFSGKCVGVDSRGGIGLSHPDGNRYYYGGEVSARVHPS